MLFFVFWSLYGCSLFFGHCIVPLCVLDAVLCFLSFGRCIDVLCPLVAVLLFFIFWSLYYGSLFFDQRTNNKEQQNSDQKTKTTIQRPKDKEQQYNGQKTKNNNIATKRQRAIIQRPKDKEQQSVLMFFVLWSLYCCSLSFGRYIMVLCFLSVVLLLFGFWSLYCSLSFGRCIVVLFLLVAVFLLFVFWSLYCCSLSTKSQRATIQRSKNKEP
jgi:Ca2+/Na+ antiporter